ncbi:MAG: hypothetical protein GY780_16170 [bacterium]|nr:hypothetical protein [bacterium]
MQDHKTSYLIKLSLGILIISTIASGTSADSGIPFGGSITTELEAEASVCIIPGALGSPLTQAMYFGGAPANARIEFSIVGINGDPVVGFPAEDMWLEAETTTDFVCPDIGGWGFTADVATNSSGVTWFENPLNGGGWSEGPLWVYLNGSRAATPPPGGYALDPVALRFNSPDINGDGFVSLADLALFSTDFFGEYHYRSDFRWDGTLSLSDVAIFATGYGAMCED